MTKAELIEAVHAAAGEGMTRKAVADLVDTIFDRIASSVREDGKFYMPGFGTWTLKERQARTGRNPRTLAPLRIPASKVPAFRAGMELKSIVNGKARQGNWSAPGAKAKKKSKRR